MASYVENQLKYKKNKKYDPTVGLNHALNRLELSQLS